MMEIANKPCLHQHPGGACERFGIQDIAATVLRYAGFGHLCSVPTLCLNGMSASIPLSDSILPRSYQPKLQASISALQRREHYR